MRITHSFAAVVLAIAGSLVAVAGQSSSTPPLPSFAEPGVSPDGREIAFVSGGDIWSVPASGGDARLLVAHDASESRPLFAPDGKSIAFVSSRTGGGDIYVLSFDTGTLQRLTFDDGLDQLEGWSRDGRWVYFSSTSRDIAGMNDVFRVTADAQARPDRRRTDGGLDHLHLEHAPRRRLNVPPAAHAHHRC